MYFHRWSHLFDVTILLLCPGVAIFVHAMIERRRIWTAETRMRAARCQGCGYLLRGLSDCRCPECGQPFDQVRVAEALRALDNSGQ